MESEVIITSDIEPDTSSEMDTEDIIPKDNATIADDKKNLGNEEYKAKNYKTALQYYSDAIKLCPDIAAYYGNRAACYMMLEDYNSAFSDARASVQLDENFTKGYIRMAKCCLLMGDLINAEQAIKKIIEIDPNSNAVNTEKQNYQQLRQYEDKIKLNYDKKIYRTCVYFLDAALRISPACLKYKLLKAECLAYLGRTAESSDIAITIMQMYPTSADAIYIRGLCLYYSDNLEKSVLHFERALQLDPDHIKAKELRIKSKQLKDKKEAGNLLFKNNRFREAHTIYSEALGIDGTNKEVNSKLYYNRALVNSKMGNLREAINDCTSVLEINNQYLKALLLRARCNNDLSRYEECVKDYESAYKMSNTNDIKHLLREAKLALKKSKRKDYYKILGITKNANDEQIKKAYRKKALLYHPDRHADLSDADKKEQEIKFKEVGEAYTILTDPAKKMRYDSGQDIEDDQQEFDPNQLYRHFFQFSDNMNGFNFQF